MANSVPRVLLADDEPAVLKMMELYLDRLGYAVTVVDTAARAWAEVDAAPDGFDVAVLDATMACSTLADLVRKLLRSSPKLCILVASGYPVDMSAVEQSAGRKAAFLHKPFGPEELAMAIRRILAAQEEGF
jgi:DNA-binding NtrC family response regulator